MGSTAGVTSGSRAHRRRVAIAFGAVLRALRRERDLSQEQLAEGCDFDRTYPSLLERGLRTPTLTVLLRLADVLNVEAASLVSETVRRLRERAVIKGAATAFAESANTFIVDGLPSEDPNDKPRRPNRD